MDKNNVAVVYHNPLDNVPVSKGAGGRERSRDRRGAGGEMQEGKCFGRQGAHTG